MTKPADVGIGAGVGAVASELLKLVIAEAKLVLAFKSVSKELAETMELLLPIIEQLESRQDVEEVKELKTLKDTIDKACVLVEKCKGVKWWQFYLKSWYTRRVYKINRKMLKFCQVPVPLIQLRNQGRHSLTLEAINNEVQTVRKKIDLMDVRAPVFRQLCSVPDLKKVPVGFALPLMMLKKKLLDAAVVRLVVSAPPGCGKTTLVTQLCHDDEIKEKFKQIFYSVVSSTPNFRAIVQNLFQDYGYQTVAFDNDPQASIGLKILLEKYEGKGILLVLDDVWSAGAETFLEKFPTDIPNLKILLTSRFDSLDFGYNYKLEPLKKEHAKTLLIQYASRPDDASDDEYERLIQKILERCAGFPLLIKVIGGSLKRKKYLSQWEGQVASWSRGGSVLENPSTIVYDCLKTSFVALDAYLKQCFLDMGLCLEDQKIRAWMIIDVWAELYCNDITEKEKTVLSMKYLEDLASHNLLDLASLGKKEHVDGLYNDFLVTQHDILRELAIKLNESEAILELERKRLTLVIRKDRFPDWCLNPKHIVVVNASLLSIFTDDLFSSSWVEMNLFQFPCVEALLLHVYSSNYELPSFISTMKKLKVVIIINHGPNPATLTNLSCLSSLPELKRIRMEKVSITFLDILQLQLVGLKKLSFAMCSFREVSNDKNEIDVSKALPSLQEIDIDYCYDLVKLPSWISEADSLEKLSITNCHKLSKLPEAIGSLSKLELLRLCSCINLTELPETIARLSNLQFLDISHCLGLRKLPLEIGRLQKLKKISMNKCWKCELPDSVRNLENLVVKCDEETALVLWKVLEEKMINLKVQVEETEHNLNLLRLL